MTAATEAAEVVRELRGAVHSYLTAASPESTVRRVAASESGVDLAAWRAMASQVGLQGVLIPEEHGGAGLGTAAMLTVAEEMGRALFCGPFLGSAVLATTALLQSGDRETCAALLPSLAAGETVVAVALPAPGRSVGVRDGADGWTLTGVADDVLDGHVADQVVVVAESDDGPQLMMVNAADGGFERSVCPSVDLTRRFARLTFEETPARRVETGGGVAGVVAETSRVGWLAIAAEAAGGAAWCLEATVDHVRSREQFGRPIGSFQAVKHRCADMLVDLEAARSALALALRVDAGLSAEDPIAAAHAAKAVCTDAFVRIAAETVHLHGGMGFTWEHPAHLYFRRAWSDLALMGHPSEHRRAVGRMLVA